MIYNAVIPVVLILMLLLNSCRNTPEKQSNNPEIQSNKSMQTVISQDGTFIAYDTTGEGPCIIVVNGALSHKKSEGIQELADLLAQNFTVITYDRRGRGESADTKPYAAEREIEDIAALIDKCDGAAYLYGSSSGAALSLLTASKLGPEKVKKLAMYEPPYGAVSDSAFVEEKNRISALVAEGKPADAVIFFMQNRGTPPDKMEEMKQSPAWNDFVSMGPTLVYDFEVMENGQIPAERAGKISIPTLVMVGEKSPAFMHSTADSLVKTIPGAVHKALKDQTHQSAPEAVVPVLLEFFRR